MPGFLGLGMSRVPVTNPNDNLGGGVGQYGGLAGNDTLMRQKYASQQDAADGRQGAQIDKTQFNQDRDLQQNAYGQLAGLANGTGPSLAAAQGQVQAQQARSAMASGAASATGGGANLAAAHRAAVMGNAQAQGNIASGTLMARQAEQVGAINSMGGLATSMAGQSGNIAAQQAGFQQQQNGLNDQRNMGYAQLGNRVAEDQMNAQMERAKLESQNQLQTQQQQQAQAAALAQNNKDNAGLAAGVLNQGAGIIGKLSDERAKMNIEPMAPGTQDDLSSRTGSHQGAGFEPMADDGNRMAPGTADDGASQAKYSGLRQQAPQDVGAGAVGGSQKPDFMTDAEIMAHQGDGSGLQVGAATSQGDEGNAKIHAAKMGYGGNQRAMQIAYGDQSVYANNAGGGSSLQGGKVGSEAGATSEGSGYKLSDERAKQNVHPASQMAQSLKPVTYEYKPEVTATGGEQPGRQFGILAQDLEKTPMGKSLVQDTPSGKQIDVGKATGALLATVAEQQRQLDALKGSSPEAHAKASADADAGQMMSKATQPYPVPRPAPTEQGVVDDVNLAQKGRRENAVPFMSFSPAAEKARQDEAARMQAGSDQRARDDKMTGYKTTMTDRERADMFERQRALDGLRGGKR